MDDSQWIPYEAATCPTPPSPDYVSEESAFSATAARILQLWSGSDHFGESATLPKGSSEIEPGVTPAQPVTLHWETFTDAATQAGMAGQLAGIHFRAADHAGQRLGSLVASQAWQKTHSFFDGTNRGQDLRSNQPSQIGPKPLPLQPQIS
jgi:hypothetical protein